MRIIQVQLLLFLKSIHGDWTEGKEHHDHDLEQSNLRPSQSSNVIEQFSSKRRDTMSSFLNEAEMSSSRVRDNSRTTSDGWIDVTDLLEDTEAEDEHDLYSREETGVDYKTPPSESIEGHVDMDASMKSAINKIIQGRIELGRLMGHKDPKGSLQEQPQRQEGEENLQNVNDYLVDPNEPPAMDADHASGTPGNESEPQLVDAANTTVDRFIGHMQSEQNKKQRFCVADLVDDLRREEQDPQWVDIHGRIKWVIDNLIRLLLDDTIDHLYHRENPYLSDILREMFNRSSTDCQPTANASAHAQPAPTKPVTMTAKLINNGKDYMLALEPIVNREGDYGQSPEATERLPSPYLSTSQPPGDNFLKLAMDPTCLNGTILQIKMNNKTQLVTISNSTAILQQPPVTTSAITNDSLVAQPQPQINSTTIDTEQPDTNSSVIPSPSALPLPIENKTEETVTAFPLSNNSMPLSVNETNVRPINESHSRPINETSAIESPTEPPAAPANSTVTTFAGNKIGDASSPSTPKPVVGKSTSSPKITTTKVQKKTTTKKPTASIETITVSNAPKVLKPKVTSTLISNSTDSPANKTATVDVASEPLPPRNTTTTKVRKVANQTTPLTSEFTPIFIERDSTTNNSSSNNNNGDDRQENQRQEKFAPVEIFRESEAK